MKLFPICSPKLKITQLFHVKSKNSKDFLLFTDAEQGAAKPSTYAPLKSAAILSVAPQPRKNDDSEPEPEDYVPPPPKASLGDALAQAFVQAKTGNGNSAAANKPEVAKKSGKKGKKMKGQKISLTGSARPIMD